MTQTTFEGWRADQSGLDDFSECPDDPMGEKRDWLMTLLVETTECSAPKAESVIGDIDQPLTEEAVSWAVESTGIGREDRIAILDEFERQWGFVDHADDADQEGPDLVEQIKDELDIHGPPAHSLATFFTSLDGIQEADAGTLRSIKGVGESTLVSLGHTIDEDDPEDE